ncbi:RidA family protein [Bradyrhizobium japonicum]
MRLLHLPLYNWKTIHGARSTMTSRVETLTPPNTPKPIGPYNHIAKVGEHIWTGGTAGFDPETGQLAGADVASQTRQIFRSFEAMLAAVNSDLNHVTHINVFLRAHVGLRRDERSLCRDDGGALARSYRVCGAGASENPASC